MSKTADNLEILADHIEANVSQAQLDMKHILLSESQHGELKDARNFLSTDCGTTARALGHAAIVFADSASKCKTWGEFADKTFPEVCLDEENYYLDDLCFGASQSSEKGDVVSRLREAVKELRERS